MNVRFHSCGAAAEQQAAALLHEAIRAAAARPPMPKVGVVCIATFFFFLPPNVDSSTAKPTEISKMPATVMKDNYEKLNSSCINLR